MRSAWVDVLKGVSEEWGQPADEGGCVDKGIRGGVNLQIREGC